MPITKGKTALYGSVLLALGGSASATAAIEDVPCAIIGAVWDTIRVVAPLLFTIMFLYGAAKYVYSAEDPSGRKQGKNIIIHAIIGAIIMGVLAVIISTLALTGKICPMNGL